MDSLRKSSNVALHVKFTIVSPSPAVRRSYVQARLLLYVPCKVLNSPHLRQFNCSIQISSCRIALSLLQ